MWIPLERSRSRALTAQRPKTSSATSTWSSPKAVDGEVHAAGWIDQSIPRGQEAWRLVKSGTLGFSFG